MDYANLIKILREKMILSQTEFAALLGVSYNSVNRWENGVFEPTIEIKRKLVEMFKKYNIEQEDM